ncbi:MAG TPA: YegP family protein [Chitinophagaceae bacterium]|nr:YegP family protein [Chitinophagaceae bacterium]
MTKFETFVGKDNEHYFRLVNEDGRILLSSEGYTKKDSLMNGIKSVMNNITDPKNCDLKSTDSGKYFFNLKAANGQVIGKSAFWDSKDLRDEWVKRMTWEVPKSEIVESKN